MQWLIDEIKAEIGIPPVYIPRLTSLVADFQLGDFTTDNAYHTLDLSAIVPAGVSAVNLATRVVGPGVGNMVSYRHPDDTRAQGRGILFTQFAHIDKRQVWAQGVDSNRHIEYRMQNVAWTLMLLLVRGWWL